MRAIRVLLIFVLLGLAPASWQPAARAQSGALRLGLAVNTQAIVIQPRRRTAGGLLLSDPPARWHHGGVGGPGRGRTGRLGRQLRSLVPVVRGVSLASAFPYQSSSFFSYTFSGIEPLGLYRMFFAAVRAGGLNDGVIGAGDLLAVASTDVTVANSPVLVDTARAVTSTVSTAGGSVQTTAVRRHHAALDRAPGRPQHGDRHQNRPVDSYHRFAQRATGGWHRG